MANASNQTKPKTGLFNFLLLAGVAISMGVLMQVPSASASTYTVTNTDDSGAGSLRQAITDANSNAGADSITFDGSLSGIISLASNLPSITEGLTIDGTTANNAGAGADIIISGGAGDYCLKYDGGSGHVLKGIGCIGAPNGIILTQNVSSATIGGTGARDGNDINGCATAAIYINGADNVNVVANQIGVTLANKDGVSIDNNSTGVVIGGSSSGEGNTIVNGTQYGINVVDASVSIKGNYIGTDGFVDLGNSKSGIMIGAGVTSTSIGGTTSNERNIISGNGENGIFLSGSGSITVSGNYIGVDSSGNGALANTLAGIRIETANNTIGGSSTSTRNVISGNTQDGIHIEPNAISPDSNSIKNNYIGVNASGTFSVGNGQGGIGIVGVALNTVIGGNGEGNLISGNTGSGIGISANGATGTIIRGNTIGLLADGSTAAANSSHGIRVAGDSTTIGEVNVSGSRNIISSNGGNGIYINGADSVTVVNNFIGLDSTGVVAKNNVGQAIKIDSTASSTTIGGTATGSQNKLSASASTNCVRIENDAGNFNNIRQNSCLSGLTSGLLSVNAPANESISAPTVTSATTSYVHGTSLASATIDIFTDGSFASSVVAEADGTWEKHMSIAEGASVRASASNGSGSTSSTSSAVTATLDVTAPTAPTVTSPSNGIAVNSSPITFTGTKEANTSIWINGVEQVPNDALTTWTASGITLAEGPNDFTILAKDYSSNSSETVSRSITLDTVSPSTPALSYPSSASSTVTVLGSGTEIGGSVFVNGIDTTVHVDGLGNFSFDYALAAGVNSLSIVIVDTAGNESTPIVALVTKSSDETPTDNGAGGGGGSFSSSSTSNNSKSVGNTDGPQSAMAGEQESNPGVISTDSTSQNTSSQQVSVSETSNSASDTKDASIKSSHSVKSFYSGIYEYIKPIEVKTVRDGFPSQKPLLAPRFTESILAGKLFGDKNPQGIPELLNELKGSGKEMTSTRDSDGDGAYDWEELLYGANPSVKDSDGDGRTDGEELFIDASDPINYDTDGDSIADAKDETPTQFTTPVVSSKEIIDYIGKVKLTEPVGQVDSDKDGLSDLTEIYKKTNPQSADSDGDGLKDGYEVLNLGTDPNTTTPASAIEGIHVVNMHSGDTVESGPQLYTGHAKANSTINAYDLNSSGDWLLLGQNTTDENGSFVLLTSNPISAGKHTIILSTGDTSGTLSDISTPIEVNAVEYVKKPQFGGLDLQKGNSVSESRPTLSLTAATDYMIVILWRSTVNGQTLIADASDQTLDARPVENLELGDHTVTWYAQDLKTGSKSAPTQIAFNVTNTAFASGETSGTSPWTIALGSIALLASLTALALFYRNRKIEA